MATKEPQHILIAGAGITGLMSALALSTLGSKQLHITIVEARAELPSLGGAVGITPNGLRYLDALGALERIRAGGAGAEVRSIDIYSRDSASRIASLPFTYADGSGIGDPPFKAMRILRADLLKGMLEAATAWDNVTVKFGKKVSTINQTDEAVTVTMEDGSSETADILLGCDGIHSAVRQHLEPSRQPEYTGIAVVTGFTDKNAAGVWNPEGRDTVFLTAQTGSFFCTYYEPTRTKLSASGVWETQDVGSRDGWLAKGNDQEAIGTELKRRFADGAAVDRGVDRLIDAVQRWMLYPVYKLPPNGVWASGRIMLLGDAAHAMSPQGESATIAMEDAIVFARCLARQGSSVEVFAAYERRRRARINAAYDDADRRWNTIKDAGWLAHQMQLWLMPAWMWWTQKRRQTGYEENLLTKDLDKEAKEQE